MSEPISKALRVAHVISADEWAGAEAVIANLLAETDKSREIEQLAVLMNDGVLARRLRAAGIRTVIIDESRIGSFRILARLVVLLRDFRPHIVHTHRQKENVLGSIAAKLCGAQSVRTLHGWEEFPNLGWRIDKRLTRILDDLSGRFLQQRVVAVSEDMKGKLRAVFDPKAIVVIENGVDIESIRRAASAAPDVAFDPSRRSVGIVARLVAVKRHDRFVEAAKLLLERDPETYEFHIIGDGSLRPEITARIARSGWSRRIHLHGFQSNVAPLIAHLDAVVICSEHEGLPMNALEAAVLGVPLVITPLPSLQTVLASGAAGVVCDAPTPEAIADGIRMALDETRAAPARLGQEWQFTQQTMAARYIRMYRELAGQRGVSVVPAGSS